MEAPIAQAVEPSPSFSQETNGIRRSSHKYRGATVEDLDPPSALSTSPNSPISSALFSAWEKDLTHLTVLDSQKRLLGYISIPHLKNLLQSSASNPNHQPQILETDPVEKAMIKFKRRTRKYRLITKETPLEELEAFFEGEMSAGGEKQDFAVVTDPARRFVLGVATRGDLEEFVRRRPG